MLRCSVIDVTSLDTYFQYEYPSWDWEAEYADLGEDEEILRMTHVKDGDQIKDVWFLDLGCSNHINGNKICLVNSTKASSIE